MVRRDDTGLELVWLLIVSQRSNWWTPIRQMGVNVLSRQARARAAPLHTYTVQVSYSAAAQCPPSPLSA